MDEREQQAPHYPPPEVIQPDPMLKSRKNSFGTAMIYVFAAAIVALVLYGLSRPDKSQQEAANVPSAAAQTQPAGKSAPSSTTGQGSSQTSNQAQSGDQAKPERAGGHPARSDSSTDTGSKNQPRQPAQ